MRQTTPDILTEMLETAAPTPTGQPLQRRCAELRPHPLNETIYGDRADGDLIESIRQRGVLNPILITGDNLIVSGHRRWGAAIAAGLETVPVVVYSGDDVLDIEEALIESNRQRQKTNEQIGREFKRLKAIYNERASRQGQRTDRTSVSDDTEVAAKPSEQAAAELGVSRMTAYRIETVVDKIDELQAAGQPEQAAALRDTLNRSANAAHQQVRPAPVAARAEMFEIERVVRLAVTAHHATAADLRTIAKQRIGRIWQECLKALPASTPYRDLAQGLNNVADQMEQAARREGAGAPAADADLHPGAGRTPPPALTVAEIVQELTPHMAHATAEALRTAVWLRNDERQRAEAVLGDFTYRYSDMKQALTLLSRTAPDTAVAEPVAQPAAASLAGDPWALAWEERLYDKLTARCERLAEAMLPWALAWTDDKGRTWREVAERNPQHANSPFRQDVAAECQRRGLKVFEEALALTIRNVFGRLLATDGGDRPLPGWAEPVLRQAQEPASVASVVDDEPVLRQTQEPADDTRYADLRRWWVRLISLRSDLGNWAELTGRHTETLGLARELTKLLDITQGEMDAIATSDIH